MKTKIDFCRVIRLSVETAQGYSRDNFTTAGWQGGIEYLCECGCTDEEVKTVMMSKWTRWACDGSNNRYGRHTKKDIIRFFNCSPEKVKAMATELNEGK